MRIKIEQRIEAKSLYGIETFEHDNSDDNSSCINIRSSSSIGVLCALSMLYGYPYPLLSYICNLYMGNITVYKLTKYPYLCELCQRKSFCKFYYAFSFVRCSENRFAENHVLCAIRFFYSTHIWHSAFGHRQHNESLHLIVF